MDNRKEKENHQSQYTNDNTIYLVPIPLTH